jgi:hypothetical protein
MYYYVFCPRDGSNNVQSKSQMRLLSEVNHDEEAKRKINYPSETKKMYHKISGIAPS